MFIFPVLLTTSRTGNLTRLILTFAKCDDHTTYSMFVQACFHFSLRQTAAAAIQEIRYDSSSSSSSREWWFVGSGFGDSSLGLGSLSTSSNFTKNMSSVGRPQTCSNRAMLRLEDETLPAPVYYLDFVRLRGIIYILRTSSNGPFPLTAPPYKTQPLRYFFYHPVHPTPATARCLGDILHGLTKHLK